MFKPFFLFVLIALAGTRAGADIVDDVEAIFAKHKNNLNFAAVKTETDFLVDPSISVARQLAQIDQMVFAIEKMLPPNAINTNRKGIGTRFVDPNNPKGNIVRVDRGNPNNSQSFQQVDHVVIISGGRVIGPNGSPIQGSIKQNPEAHIPLSTYMRWSHWNAP